MNLDVFVYSLPATITLGIKAVLFWYARKSPVHNRQTQLFLLFLFSLALNNIAEIFIFFVGASGAIPTMPLYLYFVSAICALALFVHLFVSIATDFAVSKYRSLVLSGLYGYAAGLLMLLLFTHLLVAGFAPLGIAYYRVPGPLYPLFEIFAIASFVAVFAVLLHGITTESVQQKKVRLQILLIGSIPMMLLVVSNISLMHFGITWLNTPITLPITITFFLIVTTYAIHQYRVFDIQFYVPWSQIRRRKTAFYDRIRSMIVEIANLGSAGDVIDRLAATLGCSVALINRDRSIVATGTGSGAMVEMPRTVLQEFENIVVANEISETHPELYRAMKQHRVAAVVPFYPHSVHASGWLLLGESFDDHVYSSLDFQLVEQLFDRMADLFLDKLLTMRTQLADASRSIRDLQTQRLELTANLADLQKQNELLQKQNDLLRRERPVDSLGSLASAGSGALVGSERFAATITLVGRDKAMLKRLRLNFSQVQNYVGASSAGFRNHALPEVLIALIDDSDAKAQTKFAEFLACQREKTGVLLYGPAAARFAEANRRELLGGMVEVLPENCTDELLVHSIRALAALRREVYAISDIDQPLIGHSQVFIEQMSAAQRFAGFKEPLLLRTSDVGQAVALANHVHALSGSKGMLRIWQPKPCSGDLAASEIGPEAIEELRAASKEAHDGSLVILFHCELSSETRQKLLNTVERAADVRLIMVDHASNEGRPGAHPESLTPFLIEMPDLRQRRSDVAALVSYFTLQFNLQGGAHSYLSQSEVDDLLASAYPQNIAELKRSIFVRLGAKLQGASQLTDIGVPAESDVSDRTLDDFVAELEARIITQTLERCGGNKSKAARLLGLRPNTLHYKLERYGIGSGKNG